MFAPDLDALLEPSSVEELRAVMSVDPDAIPILRLGYKAGSGLTPNLIASVFIVGGGKA